MTNAPHDDGRDDDRDGTRSEVSETDGPVGGADAVPDKTSGTAPRGAAFEGQTAEDEPGDPSIRDQRD
jgi:hypothetical protein